MAVSASLLGHPALEGFLHGGMIASLLDGAMTNGLFAHGHIGIQRLTPGHCTGLPAQTQLWNAFPGRCSSCAVGASWVFHGFHRI
jgi:metal-dependent hydrolase (beta-lactamase superfamily II)